MDGIQKAAEGLRLIEEAIVETLAAHPDGLYNSELARALELESKHGGKHDNYLTYSVLGGLLAKERVSSEKREGRVYYRLAEA